MKEKIVKLYRSFLRFIINNEFLYITIGQTEWFNNEVRKQSRQILKEMSKKYSERNK